MSDLEDKFEIQIKALIDEAYEREYRFTPPRRYRFDFAFSRVKVAVEIEGGTWSRGRHTTGKGFQDDCEKYNLAAINGWMVIRGDSTMVKDGRLVKWLREAILAAKEQTSARRMRDGWDMGRSKP